MMGFNQQKSKPSQKALASAQRWKSRVKSITQHFAPEYIPATTPTEFFSEEADLVYLVLALKAGQAAGRGLLMTCQHRAALRDLRTAFASPVPSLGSVGPDPAGGKEAA